MGRVELVGVGSKSFSRLGIAQTDHQNGSCDCEACKGANSGPMPFRVSEQLMRTEVHVCTLQCEFVAH